MIPVFYLEAWQEIYAYFNEVLSVKFVIVEPFTNAMEDSRLGDNSRVFVGTVAENVEAQKVKRRANFRPFWKAILSSTMSQFIATTVMGFWQVLHWGLYRSFILFS